MALGLSNYQFNYRGLTFGDGFPIGLVKMDGLDDLDVRVGDRDFPRTHGQIGGRHLAAHRTMNFEFVVTGSDRAATERNFQQLLNVMAPDGVLDHSYAEEEGDKLTFKLPDQPEQFIRCRPVRRRIQRRPETEYGVRNVVIQLRASDPRKYKVDRSVTFAQGVNSLFARYTVNSGGGARTYPTVTFQRTNVEVVPNVTDIASVEVLNYGPNQPSGSYLELTTRGNYLARLRLNDLNQPRGHAADVEAYNNMQVYRCNMDNYIRGVNDFVITRIGDRRTTAAADADLENEYDPVINEYGKWMLPREPFFLVPGVNWLYIPHVNSSVKFHMTWHDAWM